MKPEKCQRCGVEMKPGIAIGQTWTGTPEWPDAHVVTMSPGGSGEVLECLKCPECGFSVTWGNAKLD